MKLLQIDSSERTSSVTRRLTARFAEEWQKHHPDGQVIYRDLAATTLPPITDDWGATHLEESKLTPAQRSYLSTSDQLIEELQAADTVVIGAPMYNFSILHSRHGSTRSYGSGRPLATGQTALRAFWERRKSSSLLPAGVPMKRGGRRSKLPDPGGCCANAPPTDHREYRSCVAWRTRWG